MALIGGWINPLFLITLFHVMRDRRAIAGTLRIVLLVVACCC
ncbi:MAG: hypothetical protein ACRD15_11030 [Vicinamibacterales bacterium]